MDEKKRKVAVLMSTFNGEKYLREQLDTIFLQKNVDVHLYIRDDGSDDETINIINEYMVDHPIKLFLNGDSLGPGLSFMKLLFYNSFDENIEYFAFADQDDIWLENKLDIAIKKIENKTINEACLYCSNQIIYCEGKIQDKRYNVPQKIDLISHLNRNTISGCTFVFNKKLREIIVCPQTISKKVITNRLHDSWVILVAILSGYVIYDENAYILYRIHENNTVGIRKQSITERIKRLNELLISKERANIRMLTAQRLRILDTDISEDNRYYLDLYSDYQKSIRKKLELLTNSKILKECGENKFIFIIKGLLNLI